MSDDPVGAASDGVSTFERAIEIGQGIGARGWGWVTKGDHAPHTDTRTSTALHRSPLPPA
jgi:hypothetical protein